MKKASQRLVDTGAKTMLKTDVVFLERDVKARKQRFGLELYDLLEKLEDTSSTTSSSSSTTTARREAAIRDMYDECHKDVAVLRGKIDGKVEEMGNISAAAGGSSAGGEQDFGPSHVIQTGHPGDANEKEYGGLAD